MPSGTVTPAGGGGGSTPLEGQAGVGSPLGSVTPTAKGYVYQDTTNGALYVAVGATSADWVTLGGYTPTGSLSATTTRGVHVGSDGALYVLSKAGVGAFISDGPVVAPRIGNGFYWNFSELPDGQQDAGIFLGSAGQFFHYWAADGTYTLPTPATGPTHAPRLSQLSPKATITSGALPTATLSSGTGAQILTTRDVETVTPFTGDGTNNAATCAIALSPDNVTYSTMATISIAAALNLTGVLTDTVNARVPAGWYLKLTAVHGTIGTTTYY